MLIVIVVLAVAFDFINGFHDTANAIATVVATRVLTPLQAILMAAVLNFVGAITGTAVAKTVGAGLVDSSAITQTAVVAALRIAASAAVSEPVVVLLPDSWDRYRSCAWLRADREPF